jgi:hypothetical protein
MDLVDLFKKKKNVDPTACLASLGGLIIDYQCGDVQLCWKCICTMFMITNKYPQLKYLSLLFQGRNTTCIIYG